MRYLFWLLLSVLFFSLNAQDQQALKTKRFNEIKQLEDTLGVLSFAIVNDSTPIRRYASCQKFIKTLVQALKIESSFDYPFDRVKQVSIQYSPDSTFRVFSWQLYVDINEYHYYGTIQMNEPELKMYPLVDRSEEVIDPYNDILTNENWYGSLIYNIEMFDTDEGRKYLLFGFDGYRFFTKRKLIDVLSFEDEKPNFGAPIFQMEDSTIVHRYVLEYGADARVKLNFDPELDLIIFDHLVQMASPYPGQSDMYIPDGDIDALKWEDGIWKYHPRIFDQVSEEAPRPQPILDNRRKDIFGN